MNYIIKRKIEILIMNFSNSSHYYMDESIAARVINFKNRHLIKSLYTEDKIFF